MTVPKSIATIGVAIMATWYSGRDPIVASCALSIAAGLSTYFLVPTLAPLFTQAGLRGKDVHRASQPIVPESLGLVAATVYIVSLFLFIPFVFYDWIAPSLDPFVSARNAHSFPHVKLGEFLSALLSLQSMTLLGFADDLFDIRWRSKLPLPLIASIPLLMVYYVSGGITWIAVPYPFRSLLGSSIDLGPLYYLYMSLVSVFCTNSINILAGVNGVEAAQSLIIALSLLINDLLYIGGPDYPASQVHLLSFYLLLPFVGVTLGLLWHNWCSVSLLVGDTYCYFAGMTFAVAGILGHFSKTLLLLFIPQIFNFVLSFPQIAHVVPCPRHRMPRLNGKTQLLEASTASLEDLSSLGKVILLFLERLGLVRLEKASSGSLTTTTNLTLLNLLLVRLGPMREDRLVQWIMAIQGLGSVLAFIIRYRLVSLFYDVIS
ncbi:glycosyl transferase family 4-domain-containing protein [Piptocephalis cylindrospora]|uniref:UDP-N-acetylglucosamine--dolichyl-phosphate N-acetylglucosaminephosphotransferase n=1 Tax=Piptocephalis cylindrospora TaxID=1907219 RepID=A0A4P9Y2U8_9FUNG|nr:glycosyl transferase family 4-domain-containing protein [Piptocephalis cylindrospora]|eukprot:RKP12401.1 glycosyl transferase family 4-domain-containing protein [Piptocephalis cylindrospora]